MKTNSTTQLKLKAMLLTLALITSSAVVSANDHLLSGTDDVLNSDQIDIDGTYERRQSAGDRVAKLRKRLEQQNEDMMQKKIEDERVKSEQQLEHKLRKAFSGKGIGNGHNDHVGRRQAAPVRVERVVHKTPEIVKLYDKRTSIIPSLGFAHALADKESYESKTTFSLGAEYAVTEIISVGAGFGYSKMDFKDKNNFNNNYYYQPNFSSSKKGEPDYTYSRLILNLNSKIYFTDLGSRFRPYLGLGVGFNRVKVKDVNEDNDEFSFNGEEEDLALSDSMISVNGAVGANFYFTPTIGMNLNVSYTKFLTSAFTDSDDEDYGYFADYSSNEERLRSVGESVSEEGILAVDFGILINF